MLHTGGCHCGKVRYQVELELGKVFACNCSICSKKGYLLSFAPRSNFTLLSGEDSLTDYQFNTHNVHHLFCKVCGIQSFSHGKRKDGTEMCSINVRCLDKLDGLDIDALEVQKVDGKKL